MNERNALNFRRSFARKRMVQFLTLVVTICIAGTANVIGSETMKQPFPKNEQTTLGLYVTAQEAYEKWKADAGLSECYRSADSRGIWFPRSPGDGLEHSLCLSYLSAKGR